MQFKTNLLEYSFRFPDMPEEQPDIIDYIDSYDDDESQYLETLKQDGAINIKCNGYVYGSA